MVKALLETRRFKYGSVKLRISALIAAASGGHEVVVEILLRHISPKRDVKWMAPALIAAASGGHGAVVKALLKCLHFSGFNVKRVAPVLIAAASGGHEVVVEILL